MWILNQWDVENTLRSHQVSCSINLTEWEGKNGKRFECLLV